MSINDGNKSNPITRQEELHFVVIINENIVTKTARIIAGLWMSQL